MSRVSWVAVLLSPSTCIGSHRRMVTFSNNVEPANGFLLRYLHRKAVETYQEEEHESPRRQALLRVLDWIPQLWYHLHAFLEKHSTSDFLIGETRGSLGKLSLVWGGLWVCSEGKQGFNQRFCLLQVPASSCPVQCQ
ncbi:Neuron navigator 1 [Xenoophorus captivus]|uniref:Neuron navigator 1 n=1 Tax=Xenoophorus captivus TaxID=1517983 RepID=A0ABV0QIM7_9TELE